MKDCILVKIELQGAESKETIDSTRRVARIIYQQTHRTAFVPVDRSNESRVNCYLFDVSQMQEELAERFHFHQTARQIEELEMTTDLGLIKRAGEVTELLLCAYPDRNQIVHKLFTEHLHYVINSPGFNRLEEADPFLSFNQLTLKNTIQFLIDRIRNQPDV